MQAQVEAVKALIVVLRQAVQYVDELEQLKHE
jgi:hypothetical protein